MPPGWRNSVGAATFATIVAALFAGAAIYVNVAEQPARLALADGPMLAQWQQSYPRAASMQASLAIVGGALALIAWFMLADWRWLLAALLMLANWPYTLICIKPTNDALKGMQAATAGPEARRLVERWGTLHAGRSCLGAAATLVCIWATY
jgi:hypothetical protein